jgi:hypothetical protein
LAFGSVTTSAPTYSNGTVNALSLDASGNLRVAATVNASVSGFAPGGAYATATAPSGSSSAATLLPAGTTVVFFNTGSNPISVNLGGSGVAAVATDNIVAAGGALPLTVGSNTYFAVWGVGGASTVVASGGAGLATGWGGGSGGSGGTVNQGTAASSGPWIETPWIGGAVNSATNGLYFNNLQGNAVLSATNGLFSNILQGNAALTGANPIFAALSIGGAVDSATNGIYANLLQGNAVLTGANGIFTDPDISAVGTTINSATANAAVTINLSAGKGTAAFVVSGLTASGATLTIEGTDDGSTWAAVNGVAPLTGALFSTLATDQQFRVNVAGRVGVRVRVSATGTGTITVSTNAGNGSGVTSLGTPLPTGANVLGKTGIDQTTPGTTNAVQHIAGTTGGATPAHYLSAASNNATNVKATAGTIYGLSLINTTATLYYLRLYDVATSAPTCSSATGVVQNIPIPANTAGAGVVLNFDGVGMLFANGIGFCLTGAFADNDNTNAATGVAVNLIYK